MSVQEYINHQWETGDKVVSEYYGLGEVIEILPCDEPNIRVRFLNGVVEHFYRNGNIRYAEASSKRYIHWYNEDKGIQHCVVLKDGILTANIEQLKTINRYLNVGIKNYDVEDYTYNPKYSTELSKEIESLCKNQD
jgi:hypothetical protein